MGLSRRDKVGFVALAFTAGLVGIFVVPRGGERPTGDVAIGDDAGPGPRRDRPGGSVFDDVFDAGRGERPPATRPTPLLPPVTFPGNVVVALVATRCTPVALATAQDPFPLPEPFDATRHRIAASVWIDDPQPIEDRDAVVRLNGGPFAREAMRLGGLYGLPMRQMSASLDTPRDVRRARVEVGVATGPFVEVQRLAPGEVATTRPAGSVDGAPTPNGPPLRMRTLVVNLKGELEAIMHGRPVRDEAYEPFADQSWTMVAVRHDGKRVNADGYMSSIPGDFRVHFAVPASDVAYVVCRRRPYTWRTVGEFDVPAMTMPAQTPAERAGASSRPVARAGGSDAAAPRPMPRGGRPMSTPPAFSASSSTASAPAPRRPQTRPAAVMPPVTLADGTVATATMTHSRPPAQSRRAGFGAPADADEERSRVVVARVDFDDPPGATESRDRRVRIGGKLGRAIRQLGLTGETAPFTFASAVVDVDSPPLTLEAGVATGAFEETQRVELDSGATLPVAAPRPTTNASAATTPSAPTNDSSTNASSSTEASRRPPMRMAWVGADAEGQLAVALADVDEAALATGARSWLLTAVLRDGREALPISGRSLGTAIHWARFTVPAADVARVVYRSRPIVWSTLGPVEVTPATRPSG